MGKFELLLLLSLFFFQSFAQKDPCQTIKVQSGDSCGTLASRCGISGRNFEKFNPKPSNICATLAPGQHVCCSKGPLPDFSPEPDANGNCAVYQVKPGQYCAMIAAEHSITVKDIDSFNGNTWGWQGCDLLQAKQRICLSKGKPPMPAPIPNAVCGPQVPGTKRPNGDVDLADLNPCPLNVCCNIWGQCGTTAEFCTKSKSKTGAPGTSKPGENGCISSCGKDIIKDPIADIAPKIRAGYFEAWNLNRPCLYSYVDDIPWDQFTHIHFAFGTITDDFVPHVGDAARYQFERFKEIPSDGRLKIISFGGGAFSTSPATYDIFRQAVKEENREKFAQNMVDFVVEHGLDGVDFDWEYPGAPDIPGIPPGHKDEGESYLEFLKLMWNKLPPRKYLSIAAPASYWYLKQFPINRIADVVNYIVFMTYDLHGQWDYGNKWSAEGCPQGSCLRSHVIATETHNMLSTITKAGVPSWKVIQGVATYGRSFEMAEPQCNGPQCPFTGPKSGAQPGKCTKTAGYIANAELATIRENDPSANVRYDEQSGSSIMTWADGTQWVAYMDADEKQRRFDRLEDNGIGGTVEWAIDLRDLAAERKKREEENQKPYVVCTDQEYNTLDEIENHLDDILDECRNSRLMRAAANILHGTLDSYDQILDDGYDDKFTVYEEYIQSASYGQLRDFMYDHASDYFTCQVKSFCCGDCRFNCPDIPCKPGCSDETVWMDDDCPVQVPMQPGHETDVLQEYRFFVKDEDEFYKAIGDEYGLLPDWMEFKDVKASRSAGCGWTDPDDPRCFTWWHGYPEITQVQVPNPKDLIAKALENYENLAEFLDWAADAAELHLFPGSTLDIIDAVVLPVLTAQSSEKSMAEVAETAEDIEEAEKKAEILVFVMGFLMLIPGVGEVAGEIGMVTLGRLITIVGEIGNGAALIYDIVQDPKNLIFAIFGMMLVARIGDPEVSTAAAARRGMSSDQLHAFPQGVRDTMARFDRLKTGKAGPACKA